MNHSLEGATLPRGLPSRVISTASVSVMVSAEQPDGVMTMPRRVRTLTLPEAPVFMPARPRAR